MAKEVITLNDSLTQTVLQDAIGREKSVLTLAIAQAESKIAAFERKYGALERTKLYGKANDMELVEWEGERETLNRLRSRLERLEALQVESR